MARYRVVAKTADESRADECRTFTLTPHWISREDQVIKEFDNEEDAFALARFLQESFNRCFPYTPYRTYVVEILQG